MRKPWCFILSGGVAGAINGLFGGGGGAVLVPALHKLGGLNTQKSFATSVAIILPLCALSAGIYLARGVLDWNTALPYLLGGAVGGWAGGKWFRGVHPVWLKRGFGLLLIWGGIRCLL